MLCIEFTICRFLTSEILGSVELRIPDALEHDLTARASVRETARCSVSELIRGNGLKILHERDYRIEEPNDVSNPNEAQ